MDEETQKRLVSILSTVLAAVISGQVAHRLFDEPEQRGVRDDVKEAVLKAGFSLVATIIASYVIRNFVSSRWGS